MPKVENKAKENKEAAKDQEPKQVVDPNKEVIIVLEDSKPNRDILTAILKKLDFEVLACTEGLAGLALLRRCEEESLKLVAILSDIMMPEMDGLEFVKSVRQNEKYKRLPFVFVTAAADKGNVIEAAQYNVSGYILKPVSMEGIRDKLQEIFPNKTFPAMRNRKVS